MRFVELLERGKPVLAEGSIYERLRRHPGIRFDDHVAHGGLVYDPHAAAVLEATHLEYWNVARRHALPLLALTDTWRASGKRVAASSLRGRPLNSDNARFLLELRERHEGPPVFVAGCVGPDGDAYKPVEALTANDAAELHAPQIEELAAAGVDALLGSTLPAFSEALGMGRSMSATSLPYFLSFVIRSDGTLLDGTSLDEAFEALDQELDRPPTGYYVNCVHPSVFLAAMEALNNGTRVRGLQANASAMTPDELDGSDELQTGDPQHFADLMLKVHQRHGPLLLGGCCGTDEGHMEALAARLAADQRGA